MMGCCLLISLGNLAEWASVFLTGVLAWFTFATYRTQKKQLDSSTRPIFKHLESIIVTGLSHDHSIANEPKYSCLKFINYRGKSFMRGIINNNEKVSTLNVADDIVSEGSLYTVKFDSKSKDFNVDFRICFEDINGVYYEQRVIGEFENPKVHQPILAKKPAD